MKDIKITIISLISKNYHKWIKEIQNLIVRANVWEYVDSQDTKQKFINEECLDVSDYVVLMKNIITIRSDESNQNSVLRIRSVRDFNELFAVQKNSLKINIIIWELKKKKINKIAKDMQIVDNAIKLSTRSYISSDEMTSSCRDIIRMLAARYKLTKDQIIEQIQNEFQNLKTWSSIKEKIEKWIIRWENLRDHIVRADIMSLFESDVIYTKEFLKADRKWASDFCDSWMREHRTVDREMNFFHIIREYRNEMKMILKNARNDDHNQINAIILHEQNQVDQSDHNHESDHCFDHEDEKFKNRKCVCDEMHLFKKCLYIVTSTRKLEWTKNSAIREELRQKIKKNSRYLIVIKQIIDINILNELNVQKDQKDQTAETAETDDDHFHFSDMITISQKVIIMIIKNLLSNSVIYDFDCSQSLTYDKARFVEEIIFASDWIDISNESMLTEDYETMRINDKLNDKLENNKTIRMNFAKTTWMSTINMTLVSVNKLKKENYIWDMNQNVLIQQKDDKRICNIEKHYELLIIEFNLVSIKKTILIQKEDDSIIKTSHTVKIVISGNEDEMSMQANCEKDDSMQANFEAMSVNFENKISSHVSMNSMNSNSDCFKDASNDLI